MESDHCLTITGRYTLSQHRYLATLETDYDELYGAYRANVDFCTTQHNHIGELRHMLDGAYQQFDVYKAQAEQRVEAEHYLRMAAESHQYEAELTLSQYTWVIAVMEQRMKENLEVADASAEEARKLKREIALLKQSNEDNAGNLADLLHKAMYLWEKSDRTLQAWKKSDARRVRELRDLASELPHSRRYRPRQESFTLPRTCQHVCASFDVSKAPPRLTPEMGVALKAGDTLCYSDTTLYKKIVDLPPDARCRELPDSDHEDLQILNFRR
jgi:hypothetical protein